MTYGRLFSFACLARERLNREGIGVCILKLNRIKPIPKNSVRKAAGYKKCFFFEEGIKYGGVGEAFGYRMYRGGYKGEYFLTGIGDYVKQATVKSALKQLGLDDDGMYKTIKKNL